MRIGIALGSGGARGWCHVGALKALEAQGIVPDVVAGSSMGALVGAVWAAGKLDALEKWALGLTRARFLRYVDLHLSGGGLVEGAALAEIFTQLGLPERIEQLDKPFIAVATDMTSGREIWLREGPLIPAIRASIAIPGIFTPWRHRGRLLLDGGLVNPVPTSACRALDADITLAINPHGHFGRPLWAPRREHASPFWSEAALAHFLPESVRSFLPRAAESRSMPNYMDVVLTSIDILTEYVRLTRAAADPAHLLLEADLARMSSLELYRAAEAIQEGRRIVDEQRERIAALMGK